MVEEMGVVQLLGRLPGCCIAMQELAEMPRDAPHACTANFDLH